MWTCEQVPWGNTGYDLAVGPVLPALSGVLLPGSKLRVPCIFAVVWLKRSPSLALQWLLHASLLEENDVCQDRVCGMQFSPSYSGKFPLVLVHVSDRRSDRHLIRGLRCVKSSVKARIFSTQGFSCVCTTHLLTILQFVREKKNYSMQKRGNNFNPK